MIIWYQTVLFCILTKKYTNTPSMGTFHTLNLHISYTYPERGSVDTSFLIETFIYFVSVYSTITIIQRGNSNEHRTKIS